MSWHAHLIDDRGHEEGWWNYTHNTNGMIAAAFASTASGCDIADGPGILGALSGPTWFNLLHGMSGPAGAAFLDGIIRVLEADPARFTAMNPANGWGDYDGILKTLTAMRNAVPEWPTEWSVNG